jgi:hypothetical protein
VGVTGGGGGGGGGGRGGGPRSVGVLIPNIGFDVVLGPSLQKSVDTGFY